MGDWELLYLVFLVCCLLCFACSLLRYLRLVWFLWHSRIGHLTLRPTTGASLSFDAREGASRRRGSISGFGCYSCEHSYNSSPSASHASDMVFVPLGWGNWPILTVLSAYRLAIRFYLHRFSTRRDWKFVTEPFTEEAGARSKSKRKLRMDLERAY
jgi:hypothetical protein